MTKKDMFDNHHFLTSL